MTEAHQEKPRSKAGLKTMEALANDFMEQAQAVEEFGTGKVHHGGERVKNPEDKVVREMITQEAAETLTQMFHLHLNVHDRKRLDDFTQYAIRYINGGRLRFLEEIFQSAKRRDSNAVMTGLRNIYQNFLEWYFQEKREKTFAGQTITEIISEMHGKTSRAMTGKDSGAPRRATQRWGTDFHEAMGSPTFPRQVYGGRASGK